ncbi:MAG: FHA domain-containing protein [Phycisphaeraceae bacterium]
MMIRIERFTGPDAGRTTTHSPTERLTFGRAPESTIRLAGEHLSRYHGEIVWHGDQWLLMCHSTNALTIAKQSVAGGQAMTLLGGESVSIERTPLFAVDLIESAAPNGDLQQPADGRGDPMSTLHDGITADPQTGAPAEGMSRRSKIWVGVGAYLFVVVAAFAVLSGLSGRHDDAMVAPGQLPDEQIAEEIRQPLDRVVNEREAARHIAEAQRWYARRESSPDGLFLAHFHYKLARAYAGLERGESMEDGLDQLRYHELEQRLTNRVQRDYREAYALAHNREWHAAERALRSLLMSYTPPPDQASPLVNNLERHLRVVTRSKPNDRFR